MTRQIPWKVTNPVTGIEYGAFIMPRGNGVGGKWARLCQDSLIDMMKRHQLTGEACRVLLYLLTESDWVNRVPRPGVLAKKFGLQRSAVYRAYGELMEWEFMGKDGKDYKLSPLVCWKGGHKQLKRECEEVLCQKSTGP